MVSEEKTASHQLDLLMEALKTSIRRALDDDLLVDSAGAGATASPEPPEAERKKPGSWRLVRHRKA